MSVERNKMRNERPQPEWKDIFGGKEYASPRVTGLQSKEFFPKDTLTKYISKNEVMLDLPTALPTLKSSERVSFPECPADERAQYINHIKGFTLISTTEPDYEERGGLYPPDQSILQQVRIVRSLKDGPSYIKQTNARFDKSSLSQIIATEVGHRPESVTFDPTLTNNTLPEDVLTMVDEAGAVYLKQDESAKGNRVFRVAKSGEGYTVQDSKGITDVEDLSTYELPRPDRYTLDTAPWTAEHEIPIAQTSSGADWEIRFLPPYGVENAYAKVGSPDSHVNNIAQGGDRANPLHIVRDVISAQYPNMDPEELDQKAKAFLNTSYDLAKKVKGITDSMQVKLAEQIVKPEDLQDPTKYGAVMQESFRGNFLCVDITGVWDDEESTLRPMIIEAQLEAGMPVSMTKAIYPICREQTIEKRKLIQSALK